jgi:hypothetical protein
VTLSAGDICVHCPWRAIQVTRQVSFGHFHEVKITSGRVVTLMLLG